MSAEEAARQTSPAVLHVYGQVRPPTVCPVLSAGRADPVPCQGCPCSWYVVTWEACAIPIIALALASAAAAPDD